MAEPKNPEAWRSSVSYVDDHNANVRTIINEAVENMKLALGELEEAKQLGIELRSTGGLDRSVEQLSLLLELNPRHARTYHDDGCAIDAEDAEMDGHDGSDNCELRED